MNRLLIQEVRQHIRYLNIIPVLEESKTENDDKKHSCDCWVPCTHYSYELSTATTAISRFNQYIVSAVINCNAVGDRGTGI